MILVKVVCHAHFNGRQIRLLMIPRAPQIECKRLSLQRHREKEEVDAAVALV